jgi:hypothetical protein
MPPRWFCLIIIACWLAVTSWLVYMDVLPYLMPGTPPPFSIDLVEESDQKLTTRWIAFRGEARTFVIEATVQRRGDGLFEMRAEYKPAADVRGRSSPPELRGVFVAKMTSAYRVSSAGDFRGLAVDVEGEMAGRLRLPFAAHIEGAAEGGRMSPLVRRSIGGNEVRVTMPAADVPLGGGVLMPLHPANRIRGLYAGQRWTMQTLDPLEFALQSVQTPTAVRAAVRDGLETFTYGRRKSEPCHVIDFSGDGLSGSIWVADKTGLVLLQEVTQGREQWALYRD